MFCMKAHQPSIVLPSKSRLVQLQIYTCYMKTCFFLGVACYFYRMTYFWSIVLFRCNDYIKFIYYTMYQSHVPFRLYISLWITFVFVVCTCHETGNKQREKLFLLQIKFLHFLVHLIDVCQIINKL
jgi:hypothetical protein